MQSVADVFNLLLNDNEHIKYRQLFRVECFVIVPLTFVGLIVVNGILSALTSHLTRPTFQPQINTAEEIYNAKLNIVTMNDVWKSTLVAQFSSHTNYSDWDKRVIVNGNEVVYSLENCVRRLHFC